MRQNRFRKTNTFRILLGVMIFSVITSAVMPPQVMGDALGLPIAGAMLQPSPAATPVLIKGVKVYPDNPLLLDFIVDTGKVGSDINGLPFNAESSKLIKYFLASLTIKDGDQWVNLSPYEKDRIIPDDLSVTQLGRDMLAQDYILKQLTASLINPEKNLGKTFWKKLYAQTRTRFGTTDIPVDAFNKVWIVADKAKVFERHNAAYVVGAHLKVMLESDYLAVVRHAGELEPSSTIRDDSLSLSRQILREIIVPAIEKEVNEGANFTPLRQIFFAMVLASWYKSELKGAFLNHVYSNQSKTDGVLSKDPAAREEIYEQYLAAFNKGVFNFVKEDLDAAGQEVPRKYFSGGIPARIGIGNVAELEHQPQPGDDFSMNHGAVVSINLATTTRAVQARRLKSVSQGPHSLADGAMLSATPQEALAYQEEIRQRFMSSNANADERFTSPRLFEALQTDIAKNNLEQDTLFHYVPVSGNQEIRRVYREVQAIVRELSGAGVSLLEQNIDEIHITIATDDAVPNSSLTLTLGQLAKEIEEDARGVKPFEMELVGPQMMPNGVVVMEYTTSAPEFLHFRRRAEKRTSERSLPEGNSSFVPKIIHGTVTIIRDSSISPVQLKQLKERIDAYRTSVRRVKFLVTAIGVSRFEVRESYRRLVDTRMISLKADNSLLKTDDSAIGLELAKVRRIIAAAGIDRNRIIEKFVLVSDVDGVIRKDEGALIEKELDPVVVQAVVGLVEQGVLRAEYLSGSPVSWPGFLEDEEEVWRRDNPGLLKSFDVGFGRKWLALHQKELQVVGAQGGHRLIYSGVEPQVEVLDEYRYSDAQIFEGLKYTLQTYLTIIASSGTRDQQQAAANLLPIVAALSPSSGEELVRQDGCKTPDGFKDIVLEVRKRIDPNVRLINRGAELEIKFTRDLIDVSAPEPILSGLLNDQHSLFASLDPSERFISSGFGYYKISKLTKEKSAGKFVVEHTEPGSISVSIGDGPVDLPMFNATQLSFFVSDQEYLGKKSLEEKTVLVRRPDGSTKTHMAGTREILSRMADGIGKPFRDFQCWMVEVNGQWRFVSLAELEALDAAMQESIDGGIELNAQKMHMDVSKEGPGLQIRDNAATMTDFERGEFSGVQFRIIKVVPIASPLPFLEL